MIVTDKEIIDVANKLNMYKNSVDVIYTSLKKPNPNFKLDKLKTETGLELTNEQNSGNIASFENQLELKEKLHQKVTSANATNIFKWIICTWGGIIETRFKGKPTINDYAICYLKSNDHKDFLKNIFNSEHAKNIASWSKVASFMYPDQCFIYDSRVPFVLNILFERRILPMPIPSNKTINQFNTKPNNSPSLSEYEDYCCLIKRIHKELYKSSYQNQYYVTEMLLFALLSNSDFIKNHISVTQVFKPKH